MSRRLPAPFVARPRSHGWPGCTPKIEARQWRHQQRTFHRSRALGEALGEADHYSILGLEPGSSVPQIKKAFYSLSKTHHPDRNPDDPIGASKRFSAISDAYHVLSDPKQRDKYDQTLLQQQQQRGTARPYDPAAAGSGFSPGGRKASGLSRRRGAFRGPPPSFYRSGGWGPSSDKREANQNTDPGAAEANKRQQYEQQRYTGAFGGTTGSWPFNADPNDVSHFDREGHFKTQTTVEEQLKKGRRKRRSVFEAADDEDERLGGSVGQFFAVCGTLVVGLGIPALLFRGS